MTDISRQALFGKLNPLAYKSIEGATVFCKLRGNPYVELVHWVTQLLENNASDVSAIVRHYGLDAAALARDVTTALDRLPRGSTAISDFSEHITHAIQQGWVYATLMYGDAQVRSGHLLLALLNTPSLWRASIRARMAPSPRLRTADRPNRMRSPTGVKSMPEAFTSGGSTSMPIAWQLAM